MLIVWLPLNGNLNNQGLADDLILTSGTAMYKVGKIGQGLDLNSRISFNCQTLSGLTKFSVAFWAKVEDNTSLTTNWQDIIGFTDQKADNSATGQIRAETCYNYSPGIGIHWHDNTTYAIEMDDFSNHYSGDRGIWHHCVLAVDSNAGCSVYTDGNLIKTTNNPQGGHITGAFWLGETNNIAGCINDVRIYDHVLSPREVKEISKGLVLHYPLSMPGQENLLVPQISDNKWTNWRSNSTWDSTNTREKIVGDDGKTWAHIIQNTTDGYGGYTCEPYYNQIVIDSSKKYTWSCIAKAGAKENAEIVLWYHWRSTEGGANLSQSAKKFQLTSNPQRISWTLPQYTNDTYTVNRINLMMGTSGTGNNEIYFTDVKFEEGSRPTPWLPNPTDTKYTILGFNDNIEYDVSGYGNNGTRNGTFSWSSDTPRYNTSTYINSSSSINHPRCLSNDDQEWTCCAWVKLDNSTSYQKLNNFNRGNAVVYNTTPILYLNEGANDYYMYGSQIVPVDEWTHIAFVFKNSTGLRNVYINGILKNNYGPNKTSTPYGIPDSVTLFGQNFAGYVSDYREYATALSSQDVRDLYSVGASISDNGTLMASEVSEL